MRADRDRERRAVRSASRAGIQTPSDRPASDIPNVGWPAAGVAHSAAVLPAAGVVAPIASASADPGCSACWGVQSPSIAQAVPVAVNHVFNSAFTWLSSFPASPISDLLGGALVLIRRSLFLVPEGVTASMVGTELTVRVNTGSVAYLRQNGTSVQVSGDPWFFGTPTYAVVPDMRVSVTSTGNAGCAGIVLTSGQVSADLVTTQIDSIRFAPGASVSGAVNASLTNGGSLTLRDAVRAGSGVRIDAPVVLATDVDVDAGDGDATFAGTVDAMQTGRQSLTVTALRTTTFSAPVGGQVPLAGLLTQGIAPLAVPQSVDSQTIPLRYLPEFATTGQAQVKYGIDVAIGDNPSQVYEFDTGGDSFFAGYNPAYWRNVPLTNIEISDTYSSGIYYNGVVTDARITLGQGSNTVSTAQPIGIAAILSGGNANSGAVFNFQDPDEPPVEDRFFGDFGTSFNVFPVAGLSTPLASPLFQLPGNLSTGFLVRVGPIGIDPQLTVGVTDALRAQFPYAVPVMPAPGGGTYPVSGYDVLDFFGFAPSYTATLGGVTQPIGIQGPLPTLIDSGAPSTGIRTKGLGGDPFNTNPGKPGQLQPGTTFTANFPTTMGREPLEWTFIAGNNGSVNLVDYQQGQPSSTVQNVNTGLNLYNSYDVMFDVAEGVIWLRPTGAESTVTLQSVTTTGAQTYRQGAQLAGTYSTDGGDFSVAGGTILLGSTVIDAGAGDVRFSGTVDTLAGSESLAVNSTGATTFVREVGSQRPLASLATDGGGSTATASVATTGSQTYSGAASLTGLYSVGRGSFSVAGPVTLAGPVSISGGDITFGAAIDSTADRGYSLALVPRNGGTASLAGDVGAANPLGGISVSAVSGGSATVTAPGYVALAGNLGFAAATGIAIGNGVTANFTGGGVVGGFSGDGILIGQSAGSVIRDFAISGNGKAGVQMNGVTAASIDGNVILNNSGSGVVVNGGSGNRILSNSILGNGGTGGLGISLINGGNNNQPAPLVNSAVLNPAGLQVGLTLDSGSYTVQVFYSPAGQVTAAQGQQLLGSELITGPGSVTLTFGTLPVDVAVGGVVAATVTRASGDTSGFSAGTVVT